MCDHVELRWVGVWGVVPDERLLMCVDCGRILDHDQVRVVVERAA